MIIPFFGADFAVHRKLPVLIDRFGLSDLEYKLRVHVTAVLALTLGRVHMIAERFKISQASMGLP